MSFKLTLTSAGMSDQIDDSINYRTITKQVIKIAETAQRLTVEALANDIAMMVLQDKRVTAVIGAGRKTRRSPICQVSGG